MLKLLVISLSFWIALTSTLLHLEIWVKRLMMAIRKQDIKYDTCYGNLAFFWTLFLLSILI